jgi:double-stranded uracil-DNA glycosylase
MPRLAKSTALLTGFPPIASANARVLILGSMPSVASLEQQQYYGHPQNVFWRIMGSLFDAGLELPYEERKRRLQKQRVAVWDVLRSCERPGSLDTAIRRDSEIANDFATFLRQHRHVHRIFFNGQKSETAFRRHALASVESLGRELKFLRLPSTSPAHAGRSFAEKLRAWQAVRKAVAVVLPSIVLANR